MARNLAHEDDSGADSGSGGNSPPTGGKGVLNRREYVQLGAAVTAALATGAGIVGASSAEDEETFVTDFSEYAP